MIQRCFQSLQHDIGTSLLVAFQRLRQLDNLFCSMDICGAAAADNALFHCCPGSCQSILHAEFGFLHLCLCSSAHADNCHAACQLRKPLLKLLPVEVGCGLLDLLLDLSDPGLNLILLALAVHDHSVLLLHLHGLCMAQHIHGGVLQLIAQVGTDHSAACEDGDILQHILPSVAVAGSLHSHYIEGAAELVDDQSGQSLPFHILSNDQQLRAGLNDLLQKGQDLLNVGDFLVCDEDAGILQSRLHLVHVGGHICRDIAPVKLHSFHQIKLCLHGLGLFNGDNAVPADLLHGICHQLAHFLIPCGDSGNPGNMLFAVDLLAHLGDGIHGTLRSLLHTPSENDGVCARCQVLNTRIYHRLSQNCSCGGTVACHIVGLGGNFLYQLCSHVLKGICKLDLLCNGNTVICDQGSAERLIQHNIPSLGSQSHPYGV